MFIANAELIAGKETDVSSAYAMEIMQTEAQRSHLLELCEGIKTWFVNGAGDPATDIATIAECREAYPWVETETLQNAGQLLLYQHYDALIPAWR